MQHGGHSWGHQPPEQWSGSPQEQAWRQYYEQQAQYQQQQQQHPYQGHAQWGAQHGGWGALPPAGHTAHGHPPVAAPPPAQGPRSEQALASCRGTAIYRRHARPDEIIADVAHLRDLDKVVEAQAKTWKSWSIGLGIACFVQVFFIALFPPILVLLALCVGPLIFSIVKAVRTSRLDLENRRYELVARLLEVLARDMALGYPLHVYLDLRPAELPLKLVHTYEHSPWTFKVYRDKWLWLQGELLDGSMFTISMAELLRVRSGWTRGYSGKMKHKTKKKAKHEAEVRVGVRRRKHSDIERIVQQGHGAVQLPPYAAPKKLQCKKGEVRLKALLHDWNEPAPGEPPTHVARASTAISSMLLSIYQMVALSRKVTKLKTP